MDNLEERIKQILQEEWEEKELRKAEAHMSKTEKILKGEVPEQREWFQTKKERQEEKGSSITFVSFLTSIDNFKLNCKFLNCLARLRLEELPKFKKGKQKNESDKGAELEKPKKSRPRKRKKKGEMSAEERIEREMHKVSTNV